MNMEFYPLLSESLKEQMFPRLVRIRYSPKPAQAPEVRLINKAYCGSDGERYQFMVPISPEKQAKMRQSITEKTLVLCECHMNSLWSLTSKPSISEIPNQSRLERPDHVVALLFCRSDMSSSLWKMLVFDPNLTSRKLDFAKKSDRYAGMLGHIADILLGDESSPAAAYFVPTVAYNDAIISSDANCIGVCGFITCLILAVLLSCAREARTGEEAGEAVLEGMAHMSTNNWMRTLSSLGAGDMDYISSATQCRDKQEEQPRKKPRKEPRREPRKEPHLDVIRQHVSKPFPGTASYYAERHWML